MNIHFGPALMAFAIAAANLAPVEAYTFSEASGIQFYVSHNYNGQFSASAFDDVTLPDTCPIAVSGGTEAVVGMWLKFPAPGTSDDSFALNVGPVSEGTEVMTIYTGEADALACESTQAVASDGSVDWTATGGETYYILVSTVQDSAFDGHVAVYLSAESAQPYCLANMKDTSASIHQQECSCEENAEDGSSTMVCQDQCENCKVVDDVRWCYLPKYEYIYYPGVPTYETKECFELGEGFTAEGPICWSISSTTLPVNCTLSYGDDTCDSCYIEYTDTSCGLERYATCTNLEGGGVLDFCAGTATTDSMGQYGVIVQIQSSAKEVGACGDESSLVQSTGKTMTMNVPTDPITVNPSEEIFFSLDVSDLEPGKKIFCQMEKESSWPYLNLRHNDIEDWRQCLTSETASTGGGCTDTTYDGLETLWVSIQVDSYNDAAENVTIVCTDYDSDLAVGIPSVPFDIVPDVSEWMKLGVASREEGSMVRCIMEGNGTDTDMHIFANNRTSDEVCVNAAFGSQGDCVFTLTEEMKTLWVEIRGYASSSATNVTVLCFPDYNVDQFLVTDRDSTPFNVSDGPATFAMEVGYRDVAFCQVKPADPSAWLNASSYDLFLQVDSKPDLEAGSHYCHSDAFWGDFDNICFAFSGPSSRSVIYATVTDSGYNEDISDKMVIACEDSEETYLGYSSSSFSLAPSEYKSFYVTIPTGTQQVVCTTEADNGNIHLEMKVGQNLLSSGFDCLSYSENSYEECTLDIPPFFGSEEYIFAMVYSNWDTATENARFKCTAIEDDSSTSVVRHVGNPDGVL